MSSPGLNPFGPFLDAQGGVVLDGGLATALEDLGCDLNDPLWSARILAEAPDLIRRVHMDFLRAGADCIATASYQASIPGFAQRGFDPRRARELLRESTTLAVETRDAFWGDGEDHAGRLRPLVAASVGPYGAYLADGSEYTGLYGLSAEELYAFHAERWRILVDSPVDLMACETIPAAAEVDVLLRLLAESPERWAWVSFSCADGRTLADGTPIEAVATACEAAERVAAVGVNCIAPGIAGALIERLRSVTSLPILVYPNSGERYEAEDKTWAAVPTPMDWAAAAQAWCSQGAAGVGGCCRVGAEAIASVRKGLVG